MNLYMIPGAYTDGRMYYPQLQAFKNIIIPHWIKPLSSKEPLANYARRLLATMELKEPYVIGGVSLGGMLAQEIALLCNPKALILIATCSDSKAIPLKWRINGKICSRLPDKIVKLWLKFLSVTVPKLLTKDKDEQNTYKRMLKELPPKLLKWQVKAAVEWKLSKKLEISIFQLHGKKDAVILAKRVNAPDMIEDGGHLINITHRDQVNNFIHKSLS